MSTPPSSALSSSLRGGPPRPATAAVPVPHAAVDIPGAGSSATAGSVSEVFGASPAWHSASSYSEHYGASPLIGTPFPSLVRQAPPRAQGHGGHHHHRLNRLVSRAGPPPYLRRLSAAPRALLLRWLHSRSRTGG